MTLISDPNLLIRGGGYFLDPGIQQKLSHHEIWLFHSSYFPWFLLPITDLLVYTHWYNNLWTRTHLFLVLTHGTLGSRERLPRGAPVVGYHAMNAVVLGHLTSDVDAPHRLNAVEVGHLPVVRVQVFLERLWVHESPHAGRVECAVTGIYNNQLSTACKEGVRINQAPHNQHVQQHVQGINNSVCNEAIEITAWKEGLRIHQPLYILSVDCTMKSVYSSETKIKSNQKYSLWQRTRTLTSI